MLLLNDVRYNAGYASDAGQVGYEETFSLWTWASIEDAYQPGQTAPYDFHIDVVLRADPLTSIMLVMVTFVASLVAIYSIGYMHGDPGYWRFFSYVSLFVFSMTMLVSVSNFVLLYVFWEAVGACSYLLIGFWYQKPEAAAAGKKAFLVNRVGDFGFALGLFLIWTTFGTLNFHDSPDVRGVLGQTLLSNPEAYGQLLAGGVGLWICLLLMLGACGKSAQFPLHVWLPDAMEGPTPVSALIHAATMVTAGVYMVTRCIPLFQAAEYAPQVVSLIGATTALLAGLIALTQTDLKRVLAYSTVSQLGYMFLSLGTGSALGVIAGMFHLFTHAFFKALLFLGAGSVMHAMGGVIDMRRFGGLRRIMPITFWTFLIGCLALAGIAPFAGFFSKDMILAGLHELAHHGHEGEHGVFGIQSLSYASFYNGLYWLALIAAMLTAFYTFRAFFMTFCGEERIPPEAGHHAHESPGTMTVPLMVLAFCSLAVGIYFELTHGFSEFIAYTPQLAYSGLNALAFEPEFHWDIAITSEAVAIAGIGLAAFLYLGPRTQAEWLAQRLRPAYAISYGKFFFDQIYYALLIVPLKILAYLFYWIDRWLVDGLVNLFGKVPIFVGTGVRAMQNGMVQFYAWAMVFGLLLLICIMLVRPF